MRSNAAFGRQLTRRAHGWANHAHDDRLTRFVADLSAESMRFRAMWDTEHIAAYRHEEKAIEHPQAGVLHLDCDVLTVGNDCA